MSMLRAPADCVCHNKSNIFIIQHTASSKNENEKNNSKMNSRAFSVIYEQWTKAAADEKFAKKNLIGQL